MSSKEKDALDFQLGNLPEGLNVSVSEGAPDYLNTSSLELKQDINKFGLAGKIWQSAYTLQALFSPETRSNIEPRNPIPESYYRDTNLTQPDRPFRILELGAGTGYVGIALGQHLKRPAEIYITDLEQVVPLIEDNVQTFYERSPDGCSVFVDRLHWGNDEDAERLMKGGRFDLIIVSDCVYFPELFEILLKTLLKVCDQETQVVIGYKCRSLEKEVGFWQDYFGRYFEYEPLRKLEKVQEEEMRDGKLVMVEREEVGDLLGVEDQLFVFVGKKRPLDEIKVADDTFTTLLFCSIGI